MVKKGWPKGKPRPLNQKRKRRDSAGDWKAPFLANLRITGNVRQACIAADIDRSFVYKTKNSEEEFNKQWQDAMDDAIDDLEMVARARAQEQSDLMMIFLLKAHRPEKYRENRYVQLVGDGGGPVKQEVTHEHNLTTDLAPYLEIICGMARERSEISIPVPPDGSLQQLHQDEADGETGEIPDP